MKVPKILEAARAMALECLVPPEITTITRDEQGHIQLWWLEDKSVPSAEKAAQKIFDLLYLSNAGHWLVPHGTKNVKSKSLGQDASNSTAMCRKYNVIERRVGTNLANMDERVFASSEFVSGILKQIFDGTYRKPANVVQIDPYAIKTSYQVDGLSFDTLAAAKEHVKVAKVFDLILSVKPDAEFSEFQVVVEEMVKNQDRLIAILKGN